MLARCCLFLACFFLVSLGESALARAADEPMASVVALVVTSNRSQKLTRPDLHYADDDGARYYELFRTMAPASNVTLLTSFDRDSAKLFPHLVDKATPPQRATVLSAFGDAARRVRDAVARNERVHFYFVFAGHGDVEDGKGFIELEDGKIVSDELTSLVASVPATRSHVILDSCNSFFVINARKPGGRRFATAAEAGERLNRSLPNVGVFLSTSAEAETFEWSELGAGIFSHAVRSGLSGAADANGDGDVSYDELAAFVHTAANDVKNPRFRPSVFARGPNGRGDEALLSLKSAEASRLKLPPDVGRVTLRDADDLPWIDGHFEPGADASIYIPKRIEKGAFLEIGPEQRPIERTSEGLVLANAGPPAKLAARGAGDLFRNLFAHPFGPRAFAQYKDAIAAEPPAVYGVAPSDVARMHELLLHASENARSQRHLQALGLAAAGSVYVGVGTYRLLGQDDSTTIAPALIGVGIAPLVFAGWSALRSSREEDAFAWFARQGMQGPGSADLMVSAEAKLVALAKRDREERLFWRWAAIVYGGLTIASATTLAVVSANDGKTDDAFLFGAAGFIYAAAFGIPVVGTFSPTYTERMAEIWARDPSRARVREETPTSLKWRPTVGGSPSGFTLGLGGTF